MELANKDKASQLLKSLETGNPEPFGYVNPNKYIQHNLAVEDGIAGVGKLIAQLPKNTTRVNVIRSFQDGDYTVAHVDYDFFGPKIGFDIFRFEEGKIVEHWDNLQETQPLNPSGHSMIDGATKVKDLDKTEVNKKLAENLIDDILVNGRFEKLAGYYDGDNYIQHNPWFPDQVSGLAQALGKWAEEGIIMKYDKIHKVLGEGNFALVISEGHLKGIHSAFYDLFRIENGKIAEHWDVIEEIPSAENHKNSNGKFNF